MTLDELRQAAGGNPALTEWERFDQSAVDAFGAMTGEDMWIHTDPARAVGSAFGGTIVQSSLLMARFGAWLRQAGLWLPDPAVPVNYGFDRVRILRGLRTGEAVRGRIHLRQLEERPAMVRLLLDVTAEGKAGGKPILSAEWIVAFLNAAP